jgi:hypothetical protein
VLGGLLVVTWLMVMGLMFWPGVAGKDAIALGNAFLPDDWQDSDEWMGVYHQGRRLGRIHSRLRRLDTGFRVEQESNMVLKVAGTRQKLRSNLAVTLDASFVFERFSFRFQAAGLSVQANGVMAGDRMKLDVEIGGEKIERELPMKEPPIFQFALPQMLARQDLSPGKRYRIKIFDPQSLSNRDSIVTVDGTEALKTDGGLVPAVRLSRTVSNQEIRTWIDAQGNVLQEEMPLGLTFRREKSRKEPESAFEIPETDDMTDLLRVLMPGAVEGGRLP